MTPVLRQKLNDSPLARWGVLGIVSITMMCAYFIADVMAPLQPMLEEQFNWDGAEYGLFSGAYGWFNVFLFMLIFAGIILDRKGTRFTGVLSCLLMIAGCAVKYYAVSPFFTLEGTMFGIKAQVLTACLGFAVFGMGAETAGVAVTKIIARWFSGKDIALAMGLQVSTARIGTALAFFISVKTAVRFNEISAPLLLGLLLLCIGLITFIVFCVMDRKLDQSVEENHNLMEGQEESFRLKDVVQMIRNRGFWLIAVLCLLFYSGVFPFLKYATSLMVNKYGVSEELAGTIPSLLPVGAILLTPLFGLLYDYVGKGAGIMLAGSFLLLVVHTLFALPLLNVWWFASVVMVLLGIAFSLVPSAMWPSVPKIIPQHQLGTAYATIFWIQNIGLIGVPMLIGRVLKNYCRTGIAEQPYDYTLPMIIFSCFGLLAVCVAWLLKREDRKKGYGLEKPNIRKM
ncbi:MAG: MFS transporter [Tannerella sp.]|jgi:nitrate/nitrite transporter NarK|nr:MFS transporter [Tannerella sp.]